MKTLKDFFEHPLLHGLLGIFFIKKSWQFFFYPESLSYWDIVISGVLILLIGLKYFLQGLIGLIRYLKTRLKQ